MQILLTTNERISQWFNVSLLALTVGAMLMCYFHLPIAAYLALLAVIGFFIYDGATFRTKLDHSFAAIGDPDQEGLDLAASATGDITSSGSPMLKHSGPPGASRTPPPVSVPPAPADLPAAAGCMRRAVWDMGPVATSPRAKFWKARSSEGSRRSGGG